VSDHLINIPIMLPRAIVELHRAHGYAYPIQWMPADMTKLVRAKLVSDTEAYIEPISEVSLATMPYGSYTIGTEPLWVTDRIHALSIMEIPPPAQPIEGIGMRIDETTFWIIAPKD
jgi:hypothetical protein